MKKYAGAKAKLFEGVGVEPPRVAVINADDSAWKQMAQAFRSKELASRMRELFTYGILQPDALYIAFNVKSDPSGTHFAFDTPCDNVLIRSPLHGRVNVSNLLAAMCAALARGLTLDEIAAATRHLTSVPGRFQVVPGSEESGFTVVVDYAHTDDALRNLIALARELAGQHGGRVITLFGCGGDRDRTKRPRMGRVAAENSDLVVLTSDNPRSEDPMAIIAEALAGVRETTTECIVEPDRAIAIGIAIGAAHAGDIVLIAGKGHEKVQILGDQTIPFDDAVVAADSMKEL
jgi:UDP-N-acetylmuramoyl-L-alanyl-D-glutamate--2,6-diaminopimelate ligase